MLPPAKKIMLDFIRTWTLDPDMGASMERRTGNVLQNSIFTVFQLSYLPGNSAGHDRRRA
jgi:hypothetical protein